MLRLFVFNSRHNNSIFSALGGRRGNSPHLDRMRVSWSVWAANDYTMFKFISLNPEGLSEENSLDRFFKKIEKIGSLELIFEDLNDNSLNIDSEEYLRVIDTKYI